jgi:hypothetical protein
VLLVVVVVCCGTALSLCCVVVLRRTFEALYTLLAPSTAQSHVRCISHCTMTEIKIVWCLVAMRYQCVAYTLCSLFAPCCCWCVVGGAGHFQVLVGVGGVGKSALTITYVSNVWVPEYDPTIGILIVNKRPSSPRFATLLLLLCRSRSYATIPTTAEDSHRKQVTVDDIASMLEILYVIVISINTHTLSLSLSR